jgi:hypothetical protein
MITAGLGPERDFAGKDRQQCKLQIRPLVWKGAPETENKLRDLNPPGNYTDRATAACWSQLLLQP